MSTVKKLDPNIRVAQTRRNTAIGEMHRMARMYGAGTAGRFRLDSLAAALDDVRKDPRFTSAEKDAKFKSLLNRAR